MWGESGKSAGQVNGPFKDSQVNGHPVTEQLFKMETATAAIQLVDLAAHRP